MVLDLPKVPFENKNSTLEPKISQKTTQGLCHLKLSGQDSLEKAMPVQMGHYVSFHMIHDSAFFALIYWEGLQRLSTIVKLSQNDCLVAGDQRARGVAIVL